MSKGDWMSWVKMFVDLLLPHKKAPNRDHVIVVRYKKSKGLRAPDYMSASADLTTAMFMAGNRLKQDREQRIEEICVYALVGRVGPALDQPDSDSPGE